MKKVLVLIMLLTLTIPVSCGRRYAKGTYIDPNVIILRSDKFVESDLQIIAKRLADSLIASPVVGSRTHPSIYMTSMTNSTDEHIDMNSLSEKIKVFLHKSKQVKLLNTKKGAKYIVSGNMSSIKQPVGRQEIVYYKATLELTNLGTDVVAWIDDVEIKKRFRKKFTGF